MRLMPHPLAIIVSCFLAMASSETLGFSVWTCLTFVVSLAALDLVMQVRGVSSHKGDEATNAFLLAFARHLKSMSPRDAFLSSYSSSPCGKLLSNALLALRDGIPLPSVIVHLSKKIISERALFEALSALLEFDASSAGERLRSYVSLREERDRMRSDLETKLMVISMRFKLLSVISSASLAVVAFASPLLESFFIEERIPSDAGIGSILHFEMGSFLVSYSLALVCSYLPTKVLPFARGSRSLFYSSASFIITYLILVVAGVSGF